MNPNDFKQLLDEALKPIQDQLNDPDTGLSAINSKLNDPDTGLNRINDKLDALSGDVEQLHNDVKAIRDKEGMAHSRNKREIDEIKSRLNMPIMSDIPEV